MQTNNPVQYLKDKSAQTDAYGKEIFIYAERWAELMEKEIAGGKKLADVAKTTSHKADISGITGFMYGAAVAVLSVHWKFGGELCIWHNKSMQIHSEGDLANETGGVLNPAVLIVSKGE